MLKVARDEVFGPMNNRDIAAARDYHERTKHSLASVRSGPHHLDWDNQPHPFKVYKNLESLPLEQRLQSTGVPALRAISGTVPELERGVTRAELAEVLFLCAGVTRRRRYFGGEMLFRAAACTGALYHIDVYAVTGPAPDLDAGVYHFAPDRFALTPLRAGDHRGVLVEASGGEPAVARAPVVLVLTSTFWRNSWKYRDRAYRHCFWDGGTLLANCLAAAVARGIPSRTVMGFADALVNRLLGLDTGKEVSLCLVPLGGAPAPTAANAEAPAMLHPATRPLSAREVDYPSIREAHAASCLESGGEARRWREGEGGATASSRARTDTLETASAPPVATVPGRSGEGSGRAPEKPGEDAPPAGGAAGRRVTLSVDAAAELPADGIEPVILRRGSSRRFSRESISLGQLSNALHYATRGVATDADPVGSRALNQIYLIVHHVDGMAPGAYVQHRDDERLELLKEGNFRKEAGFLGLGQEIPADASVNVYFMTDLEAVLRRYGNRGYRLAQMDAAVAAGRIYLAAYAQGFGASGLTFFDDDVTAFFSPHAAGKSVMFLIALGRRLRSSSRQ